MGGHACIEGESQGLQETHSRIYKSSISTSESEYTALANSLLTSVCRLRPGISRVFYCNVHVSNDVDGPQQNGAALNVWAGVQGKLRGWRLLEKSFLFFFFQKTGDLNLEARPRGPVLKTEFSFTCTYYLGVSLSLSYTTFAKLK